jgi:hypothetical protein
MIPFTRDSPPSHELQNLHLNVSLTIFNFLDYYYHHGRPIVDIGFCPTIIYG